MEETHAPQKEKAVKELADIESIIGAASYFTLGLVDGAETYMVPLDFGYSSDGQNLGSVYFPCAAPAASWSLSTPTPRFPCFLWPPGTPSLTKATAAWPAL